MKKQKLIEKINKIAIETPFPKSKIVDYLEVIKLIEQLDEPQPVKVKQFVADWYEKKKHDLNHYIWDYIYNWNHQEESEFKRWMNCSITSFQTLVNMHQFGYEVEEEKRYFVKAKSIGDHNNYLKYNTNQKHWYFGSRFIYVNDVDTKIHHTRKELEEANFGWVFNCEGIEIEEVEEQCQIGPKDLLN